MSSDEAHRAALLLDGVGPGARFRAGSALSITDDAGDTLVLLDGSQAFADPGSQSAATEPGLVDDDPFVGVEDPNQPVQALTVCGHVAQGERVLTMSTPDGGMYVLGSYGGQQGLIGGTVVPGGTANDTAAAASSSETPVALLTAEATIRHDLHCVRVSASAIIGATVNATSGAGEFYREDPDGVATLIGPWFRRTLRSTATNGNDCPGSVLDFVSPGQYRYYVTVTVASGWTARYDLTVDPTVAAFLTVEDLGPIAAGMPWPSTA